jgi:hypothetical protein
MAPIKQVPLSAFVNTRLEANERYEQTIAEWLRLKEECAEIQRQSRALLESLRKSH